MGTTTAVEDEDEEEEEEKEEEDEEEKVADPRGNGSRERNWGYNFIRLSLHLLTLMLSNALDLMTGVQLPKEMIPHQFRSSSWPI